MNLKKFRDEKGIEHTIANEMEIDGNKYVITLDKKIFIAVNENEYKSTSPIDDNVIGIKKMLGIYE